MGVPARKEEQRYTWSDYQTWSDDQRWELIGGHAYLLASPTARHQGMVVELSRQMANHFAGKPCRLLVSPLDVMLSEDDVVQPDLLVVCDPQRIQRTHVAGAPTLVVEIVSADSGFRDRARKLPLYARAGVKEYWIVTPWPSTVEVLVLAGDRYRIEHVFGNDDELVSPTFPGLRISLREVFDFPLEPGEEPPVVKEPPGAGYRAGAAGGSAAKRVLTDAQQLAWDTILRKPRKEIGVFQINPMEWRMIDRLAGVPEGTYEKNPVPTYRAMLENSGVCALDQWIPENPLTIREHGYEAPKAPAAIVRDGITIDSPEAVAEHMEKFVIPAIEKRAADFNEEATVRRFVDGEKEIQDVLGPKILKAPYTGPFASFPTLFYGHYGYENYLMAWALYPEVMEKVAKAQADYGLKHNRTGARAIREGGLPPYIRLDHDMAGADGTLMSIDSLDRIWFPQFARCIQPFLDADITLIWHCDGDLSAMVPRLLDCGLRGFQGFQYECGMDYEKICRMKTRDGEELLIIGGVSVTRTLPHGTPEDVKKELAWLVRFGPRRGLFLACTSSITPGVPWENLKALAEGFRYYREHGRE